MMEVKSPEEFFEKQLPTRFKPDKATGIDTIIQVSLSGGQKELTHQPHYRSGFRKAISWT
jgi:hypothetical protein